MIRSNGTSESTRKVSDAVLFAGSRSWLTVEQSSSESTTSGSRVSPGQSSEAGPSVTKDEKARKKTFDPISNV